LPLALLAQAIIASNLFIDKYILARAVHDYRAVPLYSASVALVTGSLLWIFTGLPRPPTVPLLLAMVSGGLTLWGAVLYYRVIATEEASSVIIQIQLLPVLTLLLSVLFLQERLSWVQLAGFALILAATLAASSEGTPVRWRPSRAYLTIMVATLCWAASNVLFKFVVERSSYPEVLAYETWGWFIAGMIVWLAAPDTRRAFHASVATISRSALSWVVVNELLFLGAKLLAFFAISLAPVSLVGVVGSTAVFFGVLYGVLLTHLFPRIFAEDISRNGLLKKAVLALVAFAGLLLIG
jgi:drug/metabolite transporter (DMT)-like permease